MSHREHTVSHRNQTSHPNTHARYQQTMTHCAFSTCATATVSLVGLPSRNDGIYIPGLLLAWQRAPEQPAPQLCGPWEGRLNERIHHAPQFACHTTQPHSPSSAHRPRQSQREPRRCLEFLSRHFAGKPTRSFTETKCNDLVKLRPEETYAEETLSEETSPLRVQTS